MASVRGDGARREKLPRSSWKLAILSGIASYLDSGIIVSLGLSLKIWADRYDFSSWSLGALSALLTICIALGSLFGGRLADLFGRRRVYNVDILVYAVGAVVTLLAVNGPMVFAGVVVAGLAAGADLPTSLAMISENTPEHGRGRLIGATQTMWTVGIAVTQLIGFVTSSLGFLGTQILFIHLAAVALAAWVLRSRLRTSPAVAAAEAGGGAERLDATALRRLKARPVLVPLLATGLFYLLWGLGANTVGQFGNYFLVTVSGASQTVATGINTGLLPVAVLLSLVFVRVADTRRRDVLFYLAAGVQVIAFAVGAATGGAVIAAMVVFLLLYNLCYPFAGEANYKVWSQELFPGAIRGTAQGLTYAVCRFLYAMAALVTPSLIGWNAAATLWMLTAGMLLAGLVGVYIIRRLAPQGAPRAAAVEAGAPDVSDPSGASEAPGAAPT